MSLKYLLDTGIVSEPLRPRASRTVLKGLAAHEGECAIAALVWHELQFGCRRLAASRRRDEIERYLDDGIAYIIIGTAAVKAPGFLHDACYAFPGHIMVGLDARDGKVAVDGWSKVTGHDVIDLAKKFQDYGVEAVIHTDIGRDGMMSGVNIKATVELARELSVPVIASGGITNIKDVKALCEVESEGIMGAITGRAIYEGTLDFTEAQKVADKMAQKTGKAKEGEA